MRRKGGKMGFDASVREPGGSGFWYPKDPQSLKKKIINFLEGAEKKEIPGEIVMLISPHAGYDYSGPVAAHAFRQIKGKSFETVVCLGLSHHVPISKASVFNGDVYRTPIGDVPIDKILVRDLLKLGTVFFSDPAAHATRMVRGMPGGEHSVENQVPFLQMVLQPGFKMVEILVNNDQVSFVERLGKALSDSLKGKNILLVVSSDMSHFPPMQDARRIDGLVLGALESMNFEKISQRINDLEKEPVPGLSCVLCGKTAVLSGLLAAKGLGANEAKILKYDCSDADGTGRKSVGYGAMAFYRVEGKSSEGSGEGQNESSFSQDFEASYFAETGELSPKRREFLLEMAYKGVEAAAYRRSIPPD